MPYREPTWWANIPGALMGAGLYGFYNAAVMIRAGQTPTIRDVIGLVINLTCAVGVGIILTLVLADKVTAMIPFVSLRDSKILAFVFGAFGWELLPLVFQLVKARAVKEAQTKLGGGQ